MPFDIRAQYKKMESRRNIWLHRADEVAKETDPSIAPLGQIDEKQPFNGNAAIQLNRLSATEMSVLMPPEVSWFRLQVPKTLAERIGLDTQSKEVRDNLIKQENTVTEFLAGIDIISAAAEILDRIKIEHLNLLIMTDDDARVIPLRDLVLKRRGGKPQFCIYREELPAEELTQEELAQENAQDAGTPGETGGQVPEPRLLYTYVDWTQGVHAGVHQQKPGQDEAVRMEEMDPVQFIPVSSEKPYVNDYADGYARKHLGMFRSLNGYWESLHFATQVASMALFGLARGAGVSIDQLKKRETNFFLVNPELWSRSKWLDSGQKINDWSFIKAMIDSIDSRLDKAYAVGLADSAARAKTAREVAAIVGELSAQNQFRVTVLAETMLGRVVQAALHILGLNVNLTEIVGQLGVELSEEEKKEFGNMNLVRPQIITGQSVLTRQVQVERLLNAIGQVMAIKPELAKKIDEVALLQSIASLGQMSVDDILIQTGNMTDGQLGESLEKLKQMNPEALERVVNGIVQAGAPGTGELGESPGPPPDGVVPGPENVPDQEAAVAAAPVT